MSKTKHLNPFRPGAGHMPPYLAGRDHEKSDFQKFLNQESITENLILTGLRGVGKTVLLETFKPLAIQEGWLWAGNDLSETTSITEDNLATRLLTDLSLVTTAIVVDIHEQRAIGFRGDARRQELRLDFGNLQRLYEATPGLVIDKLKNVLEVVWPYIDRANKRGLIFAYDEAQNLADHAARQQYPLSNLLELFQSIQRKGLRFMLALTGLPTLFPKLVEARTYSERMFHVVTLKPLSKQDTIEAIRKPTREKGFPVDFTDQSIETIWRVTKGYPYFVQFVCRECFDVCVQCLDRGQEPDAIPLDAILMKLDVDFFSGRWARATDRQRELLGIVARLPNSEEEFTVRDVVESKLNKERLRPFSSSHVNQILAQLCSAGLVYKNRHGRYLLAVPLLSDFIQRTLRQDLPADLHS